MLQQFVISTLVPLAVCSGCAARTAAAEVEFTSSTGFSVAYPANWVRLHDSDDGLDIISSRTRVKGAVILKGEAEIIVNQVNQPPFLVFSKFLRDQYDVDILSEKVTYVPSAAACSTVGEVEATFEIAPNAIQKNTFFLCKINSRSFIVTLTRWADVVDDPRWRATALRVLQTLRPPR